MKYEDDSQHSNRHPDSHHSGSHQYLPPCSMSTQCLLYADRLASEYQPKGDVVVDEQEEQLIERLRTHVLTCPTCRSVLAEVRQQREAIRTTLLQGEHEVPSTTARIIASLHQASRPSVPPLSALPEVAASEETPYVDDERFYENQGIFISRTDTGKHALPKSRRGRWSNIAAIAIAAAVVLTSIGILGRFLLLPPVGTVSSGASSNQSQRLPSLVQSASWSSVVLIYTLANKTVISNYEPLSGQNVPLTQLSFTQVVVDGVAHNGYQVLYHVFDGTQTHYYVYPETQQPVYSVQGQGGEAIWSSGSSDTSDRYLFISTAQGVIQHDMQSHASHLLPDIPGGVQVLFARDDSHEDDLYYVQSAKTATTTPYSSVGTLYRANIATSNPSPRQVTPCTQATNFWLNPPGTQVYYQCLSESQDALYAVNVDGTGSQILRSHTGQIVGYASDNSLLLVQTASNGRYQILQLGETEQQDQLVLPDIAPGATIVHQSDVAVAPYGRMLVVKGAYANQQEKLWYSDLLTQGTQQLQLPEGASAVEPIGWDRLTVAS